MTMIIMRQRLLQLSQALRMLYHSHGAIIFFSFFFFSFFDWPRTTTNISCSTSSVMKGGQGTSLLSHLVLTTFIKSPSFSASILTQFFQIHPPLYIFSQIVLLFFHSLFKEKNLPLTLPILFNTCCIARSLHPLPATIPHPPMPASHPN